VLVKVTPIPRIHPQEFDGLPPSCSAHGSSPNPEGSLLTRQPKFHRKGLGPDLRFGVGQRQQALFRKIDSAAQVGVAIEELVEKEVDLSSWVAASLAHGAMVAARAEQPEVSRYRARIAR
jgi:hypothetical protein